MEWHSFGTACKDPDYCQCDNEHYRAVAWGANVIPLPTDTAPRGTVGITLDTSANTITWGATVITPPAGTIDSMALYQVDAGTALPATATAVLCAGAVACAVMSGSATIIAPATAKSIRTSARAYGTQVVIFTTTAHRAAGGAMRGTMYLNPL